jgi:hypothetical protein
MTGKETASEGVENENFQLKETKNMSCARPAVWSGRIEKRVCMYYSLTKVCKEVYSFAQGVVDLKVLDNTEV